MKAPAFTFERALTLNDAFDLFEAGDGEALYLAGGHSVVPSLALRLQAPETLIDIAEIPELSGIREEREMLRIGAMTRHAEILADPLVATHAPLLAMAAPHVAHVAIRNRGTIGGNLCHADPASEFPAVMLALEAEMEIASPEGHRRVPARDFFVDLYETACAPGEILVALHVPVVGRATRCAFDEIARRQGDYAMVGCAVQITLKDGRITDPRVAFLSVGPTPRRVPACEQVLNDTPLSADTISRAQHALAAELEPMDDPNVPPAMRLHLARVLLGRLLRQLENDHV
ncbi:FAD binding domain-containing protein [Sulfitobacter sp. 1A12126]|uniref:FAD binding domain-containing protein n=1 Tax=Sulfitobacter sp. 1A12126 TaxID=3368591 RepID=UPI003745E29A